MTVHPRLRRLAPPLTALLCAAGALTACGGGSTDDAAGVPDPASPPAASAPPTPSAAAPTTEPPAPVTPGDGVPRDGVPGDAPPHYAENHAYRATAPLSAAQRHEGDSQAARVRGALGRLRTARTTGPRAVGPALWDLGYRPDALTLTPLGEGTAYTVALPEVCVEGTVDRSRVRAEVHGHYVEGGGDGCTEPRGGH
ncbi:hypothetical protein ACH4PU_07015 [Streptomyces sp. NPDC021100]|uniref:hypothetical protein n=1 Tax=Streptomyces sp. NPDC021100 TaxID=3365114 RepID=UPI0037AC26B8